MSRKVGGVVKLKKYPTILKYLETKHKAVAEIINELAMQGSLTPRRGKGVTFLLPDKKLLDKLKKIAESADPEEATDIISALIITDYIGDVKELKEKEANIPTLIGKKLVVDKVTAADATLKGGAKITPDKGFVPFLKSGKAERGNMAVWLLTGEVNYKDAPEYDRVKIIQKKGAAEHSPKSEDVERLIKEVISKEEELIRDGEGQGRESCMINVIVNQLNEWKNDKPHLYQYALYMITPHVIPTFHLIFNNRKIFPLSELSINKSNLGGDLAQYNKFLEEARSLREENVNAINTIRSSLSGEKGNISCPSKAKKNYDNFDKTGKVGDKQIYSDELTKIFIQNKHLQYSIDEFIHATCSCLLKMQNVDNGEERAKIFHRYETITVPSYNNLKDNKPVILESLKLFKNSDTYKALQSEFIEKLLFSTGGPLPYENAGYLGGDEDDDEDNEKKKQNPVAMNDIKASEAKVSEDCIKELRAFMLANDGKLPPQLAIET